MYTISNELLIESTEINLMVTEGLADKSKKTFTAVIKKIKEFIRKVITYIKSKLSNKVKTVDDTIKKVDKHEAITVEKPVSLPSPKRLDRILKAVHELSVAIHDMDLSRIENLDKDYRYIMDKDDDVDYAYETYEKNINDEFTGDILRILDSYQEMNMRVDKISNTIKTCAENINKVIVAKDVSPDPDTLDNETKHLTMLSKIQNSISKAIRVLEFVSNNCLRGARIIASQA